MKAPKSKGLTMGQLQYYTKVSKGSRKKYWQGRVNELAGKPSYKKTSKGKHKQYWQGRIDALAGKPAYQKWLKKNK